MSDNLLDENRVRRGIKNTALGIDLWKERKAAADTAEDRELHKRTLQKMGYSGEVCRDKYSGTKERVQGKEEENVCRGLSVLHLHFDHGFYQILDGSGIRNEYCDWKHLPR